MSTYHQFCGLAVALDVIGDRWNLLIVRELLVADRRHGELAANLPGIASNLLSERLKQLRESGILTRDEEPGRKEVRYSLTERGRALRGPVLSLVNWGASFMSAGPRPGDAVRAAWLGLAAEALLMHRTPGLDGDIAVVADSESFGIRIRDGAVRVGAAASAADATVSGGAAPILGLLSGALDVSAAAGYGVTVHDPRGVLAAL